MKSENLFPQTTLLKTKNNNKLVYLNFLEPKLEYEKTKTSPFYFDESYKDKILIRGSFSKKLINKLFLNYDKNNPNFIGIIKLSNKNYFEAQVIKLKNHDYLLIGDDLSLVTKKIKKLTKFKKNIIMFDLSKLYSLYSIYNFKDITKFKDYTNYQTTYQGLKFTNILIETNKQEKLKNYLQELDIFAIGLETRNTFLYNKSCIPFVNNLKTKQRKETLEILYKLSKDKKIVRLEVLGFINFQKNKVYSITKQRVGKLLNIYTSFDNRYPLALGLVDASFYEQYFFIKSRRDYIICKLIS